MTAGPSGNETLIFFFFLFSPEACFGSLIIGIDSAKFSESEDGLEMTFGCVFSPKAGEISCIAGRGLNVAGRGRLLRARPQGTGTTLTMSGLRDAGFSPEQELLLSRTETGLDVRNWLCTRSLLVMLDDASSFFMVRLPSEKESSTKFESHSNWTMSSY